VRANWGRTKMSKVHNSNNQPYKKTNQAFRQLTSHFNVEKTARVKPSFQAARLSHFKWLH